MRRVFALSMAVVLAIALIATAFKSFEKMDADEIMVVQSPIAGTLTWYTTAGIKPQWFGTTTTYKKRSIFAFDQPTVVDVPELGADGKPSLGNDGKPIVKKVTKCSNGIDVRFNEGGHATMCGSIQYDMPLDKEHLTALHTRFGNPDAVQRQVIETITRKAVYLSGPLMSSRESYAEKRNDLVFYVEDQVQNGVYKTRQRETRVKDPLSGQEKTATIVEVVMKDGKPERQEESVLSEFGIRAFNFTIVRLPYDEEVEVQIRQQQQIAMDVQTSIADAKKAEQRTITVTEQGKANAATAKWEQEKINAKDIAEAEKNKRVAELAAQAAEQKKREQILLGEGEATRKRLVMEADGALQPKLDAVVKMTTGIAEAMAKYPGSWVPQFVFGGNQGSVQHPASGAQTMIDLLTADAARRLGVDLGVAGMGKTAAEKAAPAPPAPKR